MKKLVFIAAAFLACLSAGAQEKKGMAVKDARKSDLPDIKKCIRTGQSNLALYTHNFANHDDEQDVNSIILDIERYLDSLPKNKTYSDQLLIKNFMPLRHFFLTTTNKTTVATSFLFSLAPYQFCLYNDTATALYIWAIRNGDTYNLAKMTEKRIAKAALENCLLPSLKALDEIKEADVKYVGVSIYYGCKDTRDGAPAGPVTAYCMTLVARLADIQQYATGLITAKGLMANAELYLSDGDEPEALRRITVNVE